MTDKKKLLIVDDHGITLSGLKNISDEIDFIEVAAAANSGEEALTVIGTTKIDILITDVEMDNISGIELSKIVKSKYPKIKIIILTQHRERWILLKLVNLNVDAIVLKSNIDYNELNAALQDVCNDKKYYSSEITELFFQTETNTIGTPYLTTREKEILVLICQNHISKEISSKLNISISTVETHRKNLFVKLDVKSRSGLVREAIKYGFYNFE